VSSVRDDHLAPTLRRFLRVGVAVSILACGARSDLDEGSFVLTLQPTSISLTQGGAPVLVVVHVDRMDGFDGAVTIDATSLPPGVTAPTTVIPPGVSDASVVFAAASDAVQGAAVTDVHAHTANLKARDAALSLYVRGCSGCLDTTFGVAGSATVRAGTVTLLAIDATDAIHVLPFINEGDAGLARFSRDGAFDSHYGVNGFVTFPDAFGAEGPRSLTPTSDTSTVIATTSATLVRITPDGNWDSAFGLAGVAQMPTTDGQLFALDALPDGRFLAAGRQQGEVWLVRASAASGALDPSFGNGGQVLTKWSSAPPTPVLLAVAVAQDIFVGATSDAPSGLTFALAHYFANGTPDATFAPPMHAGTLRDMIVSRSSTITLAGDDNAQPIIARYDASGSLDATFGNGGVVTAMGPFTHGVMSMVAEQSDGGVLVVGNTGLWGTTSYLVRLRADGTLDTSFAHAGAVTVGSPSENKSLTCLALQSDGRIIVGGFELDEINDVGYALVQRYWP
jgi:uncharacterized delta-60 repeat protein